MKVKTLRPMLRPGTREVLAVGTELEVSERDVFWFRRVQDGDAVVVVEEEPKSTARSARAATREE